MLSKTFVATAALLIAGGTHAATLTQWNFNSVPADTATVTGSTVASTGAGTASLVGGATATFASGSTNGGSSDPVTIDDTGWNLSTFAAQGAGNKTRGAQFLVSTAGWQDITISYDLRHSNTASAHEAVQITLDGGATFADVASFVGNTGDTWFNGRSVDLSALSAADDNPLFGFRVLASFGPAGSYVASSPINAYATAGTWRFDMVTLSAVSPVPEPGSLAMLLAGLGVFSLRKRMRTVG